MNNSREALKKRKYLGRQTIFRTFLCAYITMLVLSVSLTLAGFYFLIDTHVKEIVLLGSIKSIQIRAATLAVQKSNEMNVHTSNSWSQANTMSALISHQS